MKFGKYIVLLLLLLFVGTSIYVATLDKKYKVERTKIIAAPIEVVFDQLIDFKKWPAWSPWIEQEPSATLTYGTKSIGEGASYRWDGEKIGAGNMETIGVHEPDSITQKITFTAPFESSSAVFWKLKSVEGGTEVTWSMQGEMNFMMKGFMAFSGGIDKQVGPDYERGLIKLDSVSTAALKVFTVDVNGVKMHGGGYYMYSSASTNMKQLGDKIQELISKVEAFIDQNSISQAGMPFTLYHKMDQDNNAIILSCAVPIVEGVTPPVSSGLLLGELKPFKAVKVTLKGDYTNLQAAWSAGYAYIADNQLDADLTKPVLEMYVNDPEDFPNPADWITELYVPIK
ncbi:SRPBCC family protein [Flavobacteriaceae bacterium F08102]|nr:SRPBCC family protein [Flavobacteriaceae bacterium F08102]